MAGTLSVLKDALPEINRVGTGLAFSENKDVRMMEDMAKRGYRPVGLTILGLYKFEKAQPEEVSYSADYSTVISCSDEFEDYVAIFESAGWEHVLSVGTCHWFKAPVGTVPIYTDKHNEAEKYKNLRRHMGLALVKVAICGLLFLLLSMVISNPFFKKTFIVLLAGCVGLAIPFLTGAIISWYKVQKIK